MAVQTPDWESQEKRLKDEPSNKTGHIVQNLNKKYSESIKGQKLKDQQTAVVPVTTKHQNASLQKSNTQTTVKKMEHRCGTSCGHHAEARVQPSSSRTSALTRTNRKAYFEGKKTPFASFGWNDSERNIGQKKTYNVSAPENEVYPPALLALKQRREDIEKYLAKAAQKRREEKSSFSASVVNHSSIWMTEYQDKFSHRRNFVPEYISKRPTSAPPCRKYAGWRYS
ncbi:centriole, cilia and spindle-associated protein-like [Periplaneta americana]|uniref:centriole, cilia and spindle-associated protein-like n=1 Tax=Periplaneta americana TaxID=6978 RepID=UPI0037E84CC3